MGVAIGIAAGLVVLIAGRKRRVVTAGEGRMLRFFAAAGSAIGRGVNCLNLSCVRIMTWMLSENVMQAAVSSVNFGSFTAPSASRKARDFPRSATGRSADRVTSGLGCLVQL